MNFLALVAAYIAARLPKWFLMSLLPLRRSVQHLLPFVAPDYFIEFVVPDGLLKGRVLYLSYDELKHFWRGGYEPRLHAAFSEHVTSGAVAYDVGANVGIHSLAFAILVGASGKVFSFEPAPDTNARFQKMLSFNQEIRNIELIPKAVADRVGQIEFLVSREMAARSQIGVAIPQPIPFDETVSVPVVSLDSFVFEETYPPPDVIKIDIEGAEHLAVVGMNRVLRKYKPLLLIELHNPAAARAVWQLLLPLGYVIKDLSPEYKIVSSAGELDWSSVTNHIMAMT